MSTSRHVVGSAVLLPFMGMCYKLCWPKCSMTAFLEQYQSDSYVCLIGSYACQNRSMYSLIKTLLGYFCLGVNATVWLV